ncbi:MAG: hypothetical protein WCK59_02480 [Candidatus Falkowbacteria bacterium]
MLHKQEKKSNRNEDVAFYFEKLLACFDYLELLNNKSPINRLQIKPDRKYGADRRIDDLTRFNRDNTVEVIQIKHSFVNGTRIGFGDLWVVKKDSVGGKRKEGTNIFKFLKSWRFHKKNGAKQITLTLVSNKDLNTKAKKFFTSIKNLKTKEISWRDFSKQYASEIQSIKDNCIKSTFIDINEIREFISSLNYQKVGDVENLHGLLQEKLADYGITEKEKMDAFINRVTRNFISNNKVDILQSDVVSLIGRVKTGLIHEIMTPNNYISRPELEKKILSAIDLKKNNGGFVFLFSPSGSGKTVLLSRLAEKNPDFLPYFCRIRPFEAVRGKSGYSNINRLSSSWFKVDIIQRCNEFGLVDKTAGIDDDKNYIDKTFDEALTAISKKAISRPGKKIVIIVDALDQVETDKYKGQSVLDAIPLIQYPGVVFLLSTWGGSYLPALIKNTSNFTKKSTNIDLFFSEKEIKEYFKNINIHLTKDQVAIIKLKTKGLAISLFYLANKLKQKHDIDFLINSTGQYDKVFSWYKPIWSSLGTDEQECLGCLCFHLAKVKKEDLRGIVKKSLTPSIFTKLLEKITPFIEVRAGYIEPYHDSFRRFVVSSLAGDKVHFHKLLAKYYSNLGAKSQYKIKYIAKHLEAAGFKDGSVSKIFKQLDESNFFSKILLLNIDDLTKVETGNVFVRFFYKTNDIKSLVKYSILTSNIYPSVYNDISYKKAFIGTEKMISEVAAALAIPKSANEHDQREWVFRRLSIGNLLKKKTDKNSLILSSRFLDDGLFRITINPNLLWGENAKHEFWDNVDIITGAFVNTGQYIRAINFFKKRISPTKKTHKNTGFLLSKVVQIHLQNLNFNRSEVLMQIAKSSKIERLLFYIALWKKKQKNISQKDFLNILDDISMESYFSEDQLLDFAEVLIAFDEKKYANRIKKILMKFSVNIPYYNHNFAYWGDLDNGRNNFLRLMSLKMFVDSKFDFKDYYDVSLKNKFGSRGDFSEYNNSGFIEILIIQITLRCIRFSVFIGESGWPQFWKVLKDNLLIYKDKIDFINGVNMNSSYNSDLSKTHQPYLYDLYNLINENLKFISDNFANKVEFAIKNIESILGYDYIKNNTDIMEIIVRVSNISNTNLKDKVDIYLTELFKYRKNESLDNMTKSENLQNLATLAASKNCNFLAENIFEQSLKYSKGLWSKEDFRFYNFVDSARTQNKEELDFVLKCINKVSDVVEGGWYWRIEFLESATYMNYELALDYAYEFIINGESRQNEALSRIVKTYIKFYPYSNINNILPIAELINIKDESGYSIYESISSVAYALIKAALVNGDLLTARKLVMKYFSKALTDLTPGIRISVFRDFLAFAKVYPGLAKEIIFFEKHINHLESAGFKVEQETSSKYEVTYNDIDLKKFKELAKNNKVEKVIQMIDSYVKKPAYFVDNLVSLIVPHLSTTSIERIITWANENKIDLVGSIFYISLIRKAVSENNSVFLKKIIIEIFKFQSNTESFRTSHFIKDLNNIDFPGKRHLIRRLLLVSLCKYSGDNYSLPGLFLYSSDAIDDNMPELKKFGYDTWKEVAKNSMKLSLSK